MLKKFLERTVAYKGRCKQCDNGPMLYQVADCFCKAIWSPDTPSKNQLCQRLDEYGENMMRLIKIILKRDMVHMPEHGSKVRVQLEEEFEDFHEKIKIVFMFPITLDELVELLTDFQDRLRNSLKGAPKDKNHFVPEILIKAVDTLSQNDKNKMVNLLKNIQGNNNTFKL